MGLVDVVEWSLTSIILARLVVTWKHTLDAVEWDFRLADF
jgi:hypothetical protein